MNGFLPGKSEWRIAVRFGIVILVIGFAVLNARPLFIGLLPFLLAFLASLAMDPVVRYLAQNAKIGRGWSTFLFIILLLIVGGLMLTWASTVLVDQIAHFIETFPRYKETVLGFVQDVTAQAAQAYRALPPDIARLISENTSRLGEAVEQLLTAGGKTVVGFFAALPGIVAAGLLFLIATFFMSKDLPKIQAFLWRLVPSGDREKVRGVISDLIGVAWRYLRAQAILIALTTIVITIGFYFVGVGNWLVAGLLIGLLDLLPVVGPVLAFLPWAGYLFIVGSTRLAVSLLIIYVVASAVRSLFEAKVVGDSVGLHPLATLFAIYTGAILWGVKGAILGPAVFLVIKAVYKAWQTVEPSN